MSIPLLEIKDPPASPDSPDSPDINEEPANLPTPVIPLKRITTPPSAAQQQDAVEVNDDSPKPNINCLLLQDTTMTQAPLHLQLMLEHYGQRTSAAELLVLLIYVVSLESGYIAEELPVEGLHTLPAIYTFHSRNVCRCTTTPPQFHVDEDKLLYRIALHLLLDIKMPLKMQLIAIVSGDLLIVTLSPGSAGKDTLSGFSVCLPISHYVLAPKSTPRPLYARFQNMLDLVQRLRDAIFIPMRNQLLDVAEVHTYPGLLGLPSELYERILLELNKNQQNIVANVCKDLSGMVKRTRISWQKQRIAPDGRTREEAITSMCN